MNSSNFKTKKVKKPEYLHKQWTLEWEVVYSTFKYEKKIRFGTILAT